ncbi:unnamed protein product, partial [marine sediment metagenome]
MRGSLIERTDAVNAHNEMTSIEMENGVLQGCIRNGNIDQNLSYSTSPDIYNDNNWHFVVITRNSTGCRFYVNNVLKDNTTSTFDFQNLNTNFWIGKSYDSSPRYFYGITDDIRIYKRVLSDSEISQLYANYYPSDTFYVHPGDKEVQLNWDTINWSYKDKVYIYRDLALHDSVNITSINDTSYTDLNLINYQEYSWFIRSKDDWGNMSISSDTITTFPCEIVTDYDGNSYKTTKIGNQIWMAENLNSTRYADGTPLVSGTGAGDITGDYTTKYYFWYDDDSITYADTYGALYTWAAVMNGTSSSDNNPSGVQGVCPDGWHLPSDTAWKELEMYLGMSQTDADNEGWRGTDEGGKLKETDTAHWDSPNTGATNSSGFTALPSGYRDNSAGYNNIG